MILSYVMKILCISCHCGRFVGDGGQLLGMIEGLKSGWQNRETKVMMVE